MHICSKLTTKLLAHKR